MPQRVQGPGTGPRAFAPRPCRSLPRCPGLFCLRGARVGAQFLKHLTGWGGSVAPTSRRHPESVECSDCWTSRDRQGPKHALGPHTQLCHEAPVGAGPTSQTLEMQRGRPRGTRAETSSSRGFWKVPKPLEIPVNQGISREVPRGPTFGQRPLCQARGQPLQASQAVPNVRLSGFTGRGVGVFLSPSPAEEACDERQMTQAFTS